MADSAPGPAERIAALEAELARLRTSEMMYRAATELSGRLVWAADANGAVTIMRPPYQALTGTGEAQAHGDGWLDVVHPDERAAVRARWYESVRSGEPYEVEFRARRADGSYRLMRSRAVPLRDAANRITGWAGTTQDIEDQRSADAARRDAEERLRESEELHRYTLELSRQLVFTAAPDGRIFSISPGFWELTALEPGSRPREGIFPEDAPEVMERWRHCVETGEPYDAEFRMRRPHGEPRFVRVRAAARRGDDGRVLRWYGTIEDVDAQHQAAARLRDSEEMHRITLELMRQIIWTTEADGSSIRLSARYRELTGMADDEDAQFSIHPDDRETTVAAWTEAVRTGGPYATECRLRMADGSYRAFRVRALPRRDETGRIVRWYGVSEDVQDRKEAELARRDVEERYRLAAMATNDAVWDHDLRADMIDWADNAAAILGSGDGPLGRTSSAWWKDRIHPEDRAAVLESLEDTIAGGGRRWSATYRFQRDDGAYADIFDRGFIIRDGEGRAVRAVGAMADLTERHRAEAELGRMQAELVHVARLSAMGTMASTLAHELNQPLTALGNFISGAKRIVKRNGIDDPDLGEALDAAEAGALRAAQIVRRLRELVSRGAVSVNDEHLPRLIEDGAVLAFLDEEAHGVRHRLELDPGAIWVRADRVQIQQVLINLVRNAIEAMDGADDKEVVVATRPVGREMVEVMVADRGSGLGEASLDELFSQFMTTKKGGMGIGLPISRTIVEAHGGKIWGENRPDGGAIFRFTLPRGRARRGKAQPSP
ncbi:MAG: PAS domain-containing protein [Sphingomonadaceae bacterium]|nr:PAS domain-containing protein [Sphingomonadaceae bacterium]